MSSMLGLLLVRRHEYAGRSICCTGHELAPGDARCAYVYAIALNPTGPDREFDKAAASLPPGRAGEAGQRFFASLAHGRAMALSALGQQR